MDPAAMGLHGFDARRLQEIESELQEVWRKIGDPDNRTDDLVDLVKKARDLSDERQKWSDAQNQKLQGQNQELITEKQELLSHADNHPRISWINWIHQALPQPHLVYGFGGSATPREYHFTPREIREWQFFVRDVEIDVLAFDTPARSTESFNFASDTLKQTEGSNNANIARKFGDVLGVLCRYEPFLDNKISYEYASATPDFSFLQLNDNQLVELFASKSIKLDIAVLSQSGNVILPVEAKRPCELRKSLEGIVPDLHRNRNDRTHESLRDQLWTYMVSEKRKYGILTTLDITYFVSRERGGEDSSYDIMEISPGIPWSHSSFLGAVHYVLRLANRTKHEDYPWTPNAASLERKDSQGTPESEFCEEASSGERYPSPPRDGRQDTPPRKRRTRSEGLDNIDAVSLHLGKTPLYSREWSDFDAASLHLAKTPLYSREWSGYIVMGIIEGRRVAVKFAEKNSSPANALAYEVAVYLKLRRLWGKHVPELVRYGTTLHGNVLFLATELIEGFTFGCATITDTMAQSAREGLSAIHSSGFLHGDIHPGNMMVVNGTVRFIDLESAKPITRNTTDCKRFEVEQLEGIMAPKTAI